MPTTLIVGLPADETPDLAELSAALGQPTFDPVEVRPFDGQTLVELVVTLGGGGAALRALEVWLRERAATRRVLRVTIDGKEFVGYDAKTVERILKALREHDQ